MPWYNQHHHHLDPRSPSPAGRLPSLSLPQLQLQALLSSSTPPSLTSSRPSSDESSLTTSSSPAQAVDPSSAPPGVRTRSPDLRPVKVASPVHFAPSPPPDAPCYPLGHTSALHDAFAPPPPSHPPLLQHPLTPTQQHHHHHHHQHHHHQQHQQPQHQQQLPSSYGPASPMDQPQTYLDLHQSHLSAGQPHAPQTATSGSMAHYAQYGHPPLLQPVPASYPSAQTSFGHYSYTNGVASPQTATHPSAAAVSAGAHVPSQLLPLPGMSEKKKKKKKRGRGRQREREGKSDSV